MCRLAADTARDIFVGLRLGVGVSALGMRKITTTTTNSALMQPYGARVSALGRLRLVRNTFETRSSRL